MKPWAYQPQARDELAHEMAWYEAREPGLGVELLDLLEQTLDRNAEHAMPGTRAMASAPEHFRRLLITRFPFALIVDARQEKRLVLALAHLKRRPNYWRRRLRPIAPSPSTKT